MANYRVKHLHESEVSILSVTAAVQRDLIFGGYSDGSIAVWSMRGREAVLVLQGHQCDVTRLVWLEDAPWGPVLYSGGGDGKAVAFNNFLRDVQDMSGRSPPGTSMAMPRISHSGLQQVLLKGGVSEPRQVASSALPLPRRPSKDKR